IDGTESRVSIFLPRDGALLLRLRRRMWACSVSACIFLLTHFFVRTSSFASILRNFWLCNCTEENNMALDVPEPVAEYLAAEEVKDADALSRCFTEDGTAHDVGQAMVRRFTLSGASVATTARLPLPDGQAVAVFVQTDIGTAAGVQAVISRIQQEWTGLDILVNNVGGSDAPNGGYRALSDDDW